MKITLAIAMLFAMGMLGICIFKTYKEKNKPELAEIVRHILQAGFAIVMVNFLSLLIINKTLATVNYSVYFICADWMLFFLFKFSIVYIGENFNKFVKIKAMYAILIADCISILLNIPFGHLFSIHESTLFENEIYYHIDTTVFFYIHYAIVMMLAVFTLITLYYMSFHSPTFYRSKYLLIAVILTILVGMNVFMTESEIDLSVVGYVIEGVCIYYCALVYTPQRLISKTIMDVSQGMTVGLYVLDKDGNELYCNTSAEQLIKRINPPKTKDNVTLADWCNEEYLSNTEEFTRELKFYRDTEEVILKIQLQRITDGKNQLQGGYFTITDSTEDYKKLKHERYLATHDVLTGIYNRECFYEKCQEYFVANPTVSFYIICTDIKEFKMINDFFGTKFGDTVLTNFAEILSDRNKLPEVLVYGRLGNDIFGALILKQHFNEKLFVEEAQNAFPYSGSGHAAFQMINYLGVYEVTNPDLPVSVMCDRARMAISSIKGDYHKRVAYYDNALRDNIMLEQELISDLGAAISEEQFKMYLQPQMSSDGTLLGAEALIRWVHPVKGQIMPGAFIPVFEKNGLISDVDMFIWEAACKQLRKWKDEGKTDLYISVNISPRDFYFLNIYQVFIDLIHKYDLDPKVLKLEITETAVVMDFNRQLELISRLRQTGFIVEMDDFGSGYSSLNMLKDIHVDVLKIDMAFLKKAEDEERSKKILRMIISLSKQLGMPVITEGVENAEQVQFLTEMGCDMFQGYYFAKPMPVESFDKLYERNRNK